MRQGLEAAPQGIRTKTSQSTHPQYLPFITDNTQLGFRV